MRAPASRVTGMAVALSLCVLAACGGSAERSGPPTLTWAVGPDRVSAPVLAEACTEAADGEYRIEIEELPREVNQRHAVLVRRLLAGDTTIDLLSVDSELTAEFAAAGFLAPVPAAMAAELDEGTVPAARDAASFDGTLVVVPWFFDPQVLWYRGNLAERAGLDTTKPIAWEDLIAGAARLGVTVQIEDRDGSGLSEWVHALIASAGGELVTGTGREARVGLDTDAGRAAASMVEFYREQGVGPGPSGEALKGFAAPTGGFLVASSAAITEPALAGVFADMRSVPYPVLGKQNVAPLAGIGLGVPAHAPDAALSYRAIGCLTSSDSLRSLMISSRHSPSSLAAYELKDIADVLPDVEATQAAVATGQPVPATPYWSLISAALNDSWLPLQNVTQSDTPGDSQQAVTRAIRGELR